MLDANKKDIAIYRNFIGVSRSNFPEKFDKFNGKDPW